MSKSVRFQVTQKEIDDNGNVSNEIDYVMTSDYTVSSQGTLSIVSSNTYQTISFSSIVTASITRISSDENVYVKLNGGSTEFLISNNMVFLGALTSISIRNISGSTASVTYQIYGA